MNTNTTTINAMDRGCQVDPFAKDRAISNLVMRGSPPLPDISDRILVAGDENDSPSSAVRKIRSSRLGRDMAIHI